MKERVLILRPDNIGDCLLFSGTLKYYRHLFDGHITLAVKRNIAPFFSNCPYVDEIIDYKDISYAKISTPYWSAFNHIIKWWLELKYFFGKRRMSWDTIVCPVRSVSLEMLWTVRNCNARQKIGILGCPVNFPPGKQYLKERAFTAWMTISEKQQWQHELVTNFDFLRFLGSQIDSLDSIAPEWWFDENPVKGVINYLPIGTPYLLIIPYGTTPHKEIPDEKYVEIARSKSSNEHILISGVAADSRRAEGLRKILNRAGFKVINLCGKSNLIEFVGLIRNADAVVAIDTGGLHFSIAMKKTTYCIVGGGHFGRFFPWGDPKHVHWLNGRMDCFQCNWVCKFGDYRCVSTLHLND